MTVNASESSVEYIPSLKYLETTLNEINNAKKSINLTMYLLSVKEHETGWQSYQLVDALVKAKERGVKVEVILDQSYDFERGTPTKENLQSKNTEAYELLKKNGITVLFDTPQVYTHSKVLVIDGETVILGSTNWSNAALTANNEANVLIHSKEVAQAVLEDQKKIEIQAPRVEVSEMVPISWTFTNSERFLGRMMTRGAERAFDVYLYLLKEYDGSAEAKVIVDHDALARALGIERMTSEAYRRQIIKALEQLQNDYHLISVSTPYGQSSEVILKDYADPSKPYSKPIDKFVYLPKTYWKYGWDKALSFPGKIMYIVNLSYVAVSPISPRWSSTVDALAERFHISGHSVSAGTTDLRRADLVEVRYDEISKDGGPRQSNIYLPNALYDPVERQAQFKDLERAYGQEKYAQVREYAKIVYEDNNLSGIKALLELDRQYGPEIVRQAVDVVKIKGPDNPKRSMGYLISTVKGIAAKQ